MAQRIKPISGGEIRIKKQLNKWFTFPDDLPTQRFKGYETREDPTQNRGAFIAGQNVAFNSARVPTVRLGYEVIGTEATDSTPVKRAWFFETRGGIQWEIKTYDTFVYGRVVNVMDEFELLKGGFTTGLEFGYGNIGKSSQATNHTYFCNGTEAWYRFNGVYAIYASNNGSDQITVSGSTSLSDLGFYAQTALGDSTTQFDITNPSGTTFRYTYDGTGTDPSISTATFGIGQKIWLGAQNFNAANNGIFTITGVGTNYFEITNAAGVAENNKTIGSGFIYYNLQSAIVNGTEFYYKTLSAQTFQGVNAIPGGLTAGDYIIQTPQILVTSTDPIIGSVAMAHDGRLHARNEAKEDVWNYSKLDDPSNFTTGSSDGDGGAKEVEQGGPITSFGKLNKGALCFKNRIIKLLQFNQVGTRLDSPVYSTLITTDDKSTSLGAVNQKSTFSTPSGTVFVTPDKRMVLLTGVTANNEPQYLFLSDPIQPVFTQGIHDEATGICVDNIIWYSFKQDINSTYNDVVLRGDMTRQSVTSEGKVIPVVWDTPYIGWNVNDWTAVYNSALGRNDVHWHSSINSSSYAIIDSKIDNTQSYTATIRTWYENFGLPYNQKKLDYLYLEVQMTQNTELTLTLLYDEDGYTQITPFVLTGDDEQVFNSSEYNPFGASPFGYRQIGSNPNSSALKKYRYWIETSNNIWFFNLSIQLTVTDQGNDFELVRYAARITEVSEDMDMKYKKGE